MIPSNQIITRSAIFVPLETTWAMVDALYGGTQTMREAGEFYLPKAPKETANDYANRLKSSVLANFYKQAVSSTNDLVFNEGIETSNVTPTVQNFFDDVNAKGDNLETFTREVMKSAIHYGVSYVITDFTRNEDNPISDFDRPYWSMVEAPSMIALESQMYRGVETITHVRFEELTTRAYNASAGLGDFNTSLNYGSKLVSQIRAYWLDIETDPANPVVRFEIYQRPRDSKWELVAEGTQQGITRIPIVPFYGNKTGYYIGRPLYDDLAELNVRHWQSYSDQSNLLHYARFPILMGIGIEERDSNGDIIEIEIGANTVLRSSNPNADLKFVEHTGASVDSGWQDIDRLEDLMTIFGPSLAVNAGGNGSTATEWVLRASALNSTLKSIAEATENGLNHLMSFTVPYLSEAVFPEFDIDPSCLKLDGAKAESPSSSETYSDSESSDSMPNAAERTVNRTMENGTQTLANAAAARS